MPRRSRRFCKFCQPERRGKRAAVCQLNADMCWFVLCESCNRIGPGRTNMVEAWDEWESVDLGHHTC